MHTSDTATRDAYITGLLDLADYLTANPAVPVPHYGTTVSVHADSADHGGCAQVDHIAALLGVPAENKLDSTGYYEAKRAFGPIEYLAWAASDATTAHHHAAASYWGCVIPDAQTSDA